MELLNDELSLINFVSVSPKGEDVPLLKEASGEEILSAEMTELQKNQCEFEVEPYRTIAAIGPPAKDSI